MFLICKRWLFAVKTKLEMFGGALRFTPRRGTSGCGVDLWGRLPGHFSSLAPFGEGLRRTPKIKWPTKVIGNATFLGDCSLG